MAIAFGRTLRSLGKDDFRWPRFVWLVAAAALTGWTWWFFTAQIPDSQSGWASPARVAWRAIGVSPRHSDFKDAHKQ